MTDPIADYLTRIRNAQMAGQSEVSIPYSKVKESIAHTMQKNQFLQSVEVDRSGKFPVLKLGLVAKKLTLKRISKPGQRIYLHADQIRKVLNGFGIAVISTSQGIMTGYQARKLNIGGECLCEIS
jgi:small subunit ribosomal protein S8